MNYNPACDLCPLHETADTVCMRGAGPHDAQIMIVGEAPGYNEDRTGQPFVGRAGEALNEILAQSGFRRDQIFVTNAAKCRPPDNRDPSAKELKACRQYLVEEIHTVQPKVILALGNYAMKTLTGESGITKFRGELLPLSGSFPPLETKVFPTIHPAAGLKYPHMRRQTEEDIAALRKLLDDDFVDIPIPWQEAMYYEVPLRTPPIRWVSFDCETNARETHDPFVHVYCVAVDCGRENIDVFRDVSRFIRSVGIRRNVGPRFVGHNASRFDRLQIRRQFGLDIKCDDTMLMAFLLHEEWGPAKRLNLEALCAFYLGVRPWKKDVTWDWRQAHSIPWPKAMEYCARDTRYTRQLALKLAPALEEEGLWKLYDRLLLPASRAVADMEEKGLYVNRAHVAEARTYWEQEAEKHLYTVLDIADSAGLQDFNPRSPAQVSELLFNRLGFYATEYTKKGRASTAVGVLKKIREEVNEGYQDSANVEILDALLKYRRTQKMLGTYIAHFEDEPDRYGMWYPWTSLTQTVTGRTSGNSQQIPRTDTGPMIRRCVGVPPGYVLLQADYSQLEMRVAASRYVFDEPNLRDAFTKGLDVHRLLASTITGKPYDQVTKDERQNAKPPNFLFLYGGEEEMYMRTLLEDQDIVKSLDEATFERDAFFRRWDRLAAGHGRTLSVFYDADGNIKQDWVRTCFGFKRRLPDIRSKERAVVLAAYREAVNVVVQNPACYIALVGLVLLGSAGLDVRSFQHDAYLVWVPDSEAAVRAAAAQIRYLLEAGVPQVLRSEFGLEWDVPLKVDITAGTAWTVDDRQAWVA